MAKIEEYLEEYLKDLKPVTISNSLDEVFEGFRVYNNFTFLPILDDEKKALGILKEADFKHYVYSPYGKDLLKNSALNKSLKDFIHVTPICEIDDPIDYILDCFLKDSDYECIIITKNAKYLGILKANDIVAIMNQRLLKIKEINSISKAIVTTNDQINTPLSVIIGRASLLPKFINQGKNSKVLEAIDIIKEQAFRIRYTLDYLKNLKEVKSKEYKLDGVEMIDFDYSKRKVP